MQEVFLIKCLPNFESVFWQYILLALQIWVHMTGYMLERTTRGQTQDD